MIRQRARTRNEIYACVRKPRAGSRPIRQPEPRGWSVAPFPARIYARSVDSSARPPLNFLILIRFIGTCLVTFWLPRRYLIGAYKASIR